MYESFFPDSSKGESLTECGWHYSLTSAIYPQKPLQNSVT